MPSPRTLAEREQFARMLLDVLADPDIRRQVREALRMTDAEHARRAQLAGGYATTAREARDLKSARLASRGGRNG